jgi:hypothetical protein
MNDFMNTDEIDPETLQQIIDMEERHKNIELDALLAQQLNTNNNHIDDDESMSDIIEQIRQLEENEKKKSKELEINEDRLLRQEQDREYEESLLQDMQKENEKKQNISPIIEDVTEDVVNDYDTTNSNTKIEPIVEEPKSLTSAELRAMRLKHFTK